MWEGGQGSRGAVGDPRAGRGHGDIPGQGVQNNPSFLGLPKGIKGVNWCPRQENGGKAPPSSSSSFCNKAQLDPLCCQQPPLWGFGGELGKSQFAIRKIQGNVSLPSGNSREIAGKCREFTVCRHPRSKDSAGGASGLRCHLVVPLSDAERGRLGSARSLWGGTGAGRFRGFGVGGWWGGRGVPGSGVVPIPLLQRCWQTRGTPDPEPGRSQLSSVPGMKGRMFQGEEDLGQMDKCHCQQ